MMEAAVVLFGLLTGTGSFDFDSISKFRSGAAAEAFVPEGWRVESRHEGDLTGDDVADLVLVLIREGDRALVVLAREKNQFNLLGYNSRGMLQCHGCGGSAGGDGAPRIEIAKRILVVNQERGSTSYAEVSTHRFRVDRKTGHLVLIGVDFFSAAKEEGTSEITSTNLLTGRRETERSTGTGSPERKTQRVRAKTRPIEDVEAEF
jgi:hypothetical protein